MRIRPITFILLALIITSCGEYEKLLKSTDNELKRQKVFDYYDDGKYTRSIELLSQIMPRYRATDQAEQLSWINAQAHYRIRDYLMAGQYYQEFADTYPGSNNAEEASYLAAMCEYYQSPRPELDQANTRKAIESFTIFMQRYPTSTHNDECKSRILELQEKLVEKSYLSARLYYDLKEYRAATISLANSLKEYPDTKYREEHMFLKLDALYQYAVNSVPEKKVERYQTTLDEYYSFIEEYPQSTFLREANRISENTAKFLNVDTAVQPTENN